MIAYRTVPSRTLIRPRCDDGFWIEPRETIEVIIAEETARDTGLVDQHGDRIMRVPSKVPVGFCR